MANAEPAAEEPHDGRDDATRAARSLLEKERSGVLCTAHQRRDGWPFGSVVPYAVLPDGDPVVWLSDIAEHTKNLEAEPRASLFVADSGSRERPQAGPRVSLLVRAERPAGPEDAAALDAYYGRFPEAQAMSSAHGFSVFVLRVVEVRWIAGFGEMGWIAREKWSGSPVDPISKHSKSIVDHMNADHAGALAEIVAHFARADVLSAKTTSVDRTGLHVEFTVRGSVRPSSVRIAFPAPVATPDEVRQAVIAMLAQARKAKA